MFVPSVRIPLYGDPVDNMTYNDLGNEFTKIQELDRDRGLIDPTRRNPLISLTNDTDDLYVDGIPNQLNIFQNNYDIGDNTIYSDAQQLLRLQEAGSINPQYTDDEKLMTEQLNFDLDPQLRATLYRESTQSNDNIYSQQSQDFVKQIQADIQAYFDEKNLYFQGLSTDDIAQAKLSGLTQEQRDILSGQATAFDPLLSGFIAGVEKAETERQARMKARQEIFEKEGTLAGKKTSATTEQKIIKPTLEPPKAKARKPKKKMP
jgi:hypothetical protein